MNYFVAREAFERTGHAFGCTSQLIDMIPPECDAGLDSDPERIFEDKKFMMRDLKDAINTFVGIKEKPVFKYLMVNNADPKFWDLPFDKREEVYDQRRVQFQNAVKVYSKFTEDLCTDSDESVDEANETTPVSEVTANEGTPENTEPITDSTSVQEVDYWGAPILPGTELVSVATFLCGEAVFRHGIKTLKFIQKHRILVPVTKLSLLEDTLDGDVLL